MWSQRSPTQNHWTHEAGRLVHSSAGNFKLWFIVLQRFVRSIRSGNFPPYTQSLTKLVHWFFTYDHYHYVIWVSVHLRDMMTLSHLHPTCKQDSWRDTSWSRRRVMATYRCCKGWWCSWWPNRVFRCPDEVDVQHTRDGMCHYWLWKMSRSRIVQECRRYSCKMWYQ